MIWNLFYSASKIIKEYQEAHLSNKILAISWSVDISKKRLKKSKHKVGLSPSKKILCYLIDGKLFKSDEKLFSFSRYLGFCQDFLVM